MHYGINLSRSIVVPISLRMYLKARYKAAGYLLLPLAETNLNNGIVQPYNLYMVDMELQPAIV